MRIDKDIRPARTNIRHSASGGFKKTSLRGPVSPASPHGMRPGGPPLRRRSKNSGKRFFYFLIFLIVIFGTFGYQVLFSRNTAPVFQSLTRLPVVREIRSLVGADSGLLKGESRDRINVLLLGQGGPGHDGPYLTDTIMLASFKPSTGQLAMLSIPRDLVVKIPNVGLRRVNEANSWGETTDYSGGGAALAAKVIEKMFRLPINYYIRIDFDGFVEAIDELGGITINIERGFTDYEYPDSNYGYETVSFEVGRQILSGKEALKFARSRHASNGEGGDFARARRQQQLIVALKDKILTPATLLNPSKLTKIFASLANNIATNAQLWELPRALSLGKDVNFDKITTKVLDDGPGGPLYPTVTEDGAYVLAPKIADYSELQFIARNLFTIADIRDEHTSLVIQNGTQEPGLAQNTATILSSFEFDITGITNAETRDYKKTVIFDLTGGQKASSLRFLENTLQVKAQKTLPPTDSGLSEADFLIILGKDQLSS